MKSTWVKLDTVRPCSTGWSRTYRVIVWIDDVRVPSLDRRGFETKKLAEQYANSIKGGK